MEYNNNKEIEKILEEIDISEEAPIEEPMRQYYFIKKGRAYVAELSEKLGRPLYVCVNTFGCQMNAVSAI